MKKLLVLCVVPGIVLVLSVSSFAALIENPNGTITDTDTGLMWIQDANYAMTSGYDADGRMTWDTAMTWADTLVFAGYDDWRLPSAINSDGSGPCYDYNCSGSEMGHLYYIEGITSFSFIPFTNVQDNRYWYGTEYAADSAWAFDFRGDGGHQDPDGKFDLHYAFAVRAVPEPTSLLLLGTGLVGLMGIKRKIRK